MKNQIIELGDEVRCKVTKLQGVVTSITKHLTGCDRISIQPPVDREGKWRDGYQIDLAACEIVKKAKVPPEDVQEPESPTKKVGGPPTKILPRQ